MIKHIRHICLVLCLLVVSSCVNDYLGKEGEPPSDVSAGQILVWHTWEGEAQETLHNIFVNFTALHPNVTIIDEAYLLDGFQETYIEQVQAGLGPDLIIVPSSFVHQMAGEQVIEKIHQDDVDLSNYLSTALQMLREENHILGLPLALNTSVLYYNKVLLGPPATSETNNEALTSLIQNKQSTVTDTQTIGVLDDLLTEVMAGEVEVETFKAATDLDTLLQQANQGKVLALPSDFYGSAWGIQTFGGQLFDEEGRVTLNQGSFANWLGWLKSAQDIPYVFLNRNRDELKTLFEQGQATYYVGNTQELASLQTALSEDVLGVIRLPSQQNQAAGPFLQAEVLMLNRVSTPQSKQLALNLAKFLTNAEQQRELALAVGKLPANNRVNIDSRVAPIVAEFIAQSKTAVAIPLADIDKFNSLVAEGDSTVGNVLGGELSSGDAAIALTQKINDQYGLETIVVSQQTEVCTASGRITLWNTWQGAASDALGQIRLAFMDYCPEAAIGLVQVEPSNFDTRLAQAVERNQVPTMFLGTNHQIRTLAREELILNLNTLIDDDFLQRFRPLAGQVTHYNDNIYGIPVNLDITALYYNTDRVADPPVVLDDLLIAASPESQVAIPIGFEDSFWGIAAFGESGVTPQILNDENRLILGEMGLTEWLTWLKAAQTQPGIVLSQDKAELRNLFIEEQATYLIGHSSELKILQKALGSEKVGVLPLPSGQPLLEADSLFITPFASPEEQELAITFAQFLTQVDNQQILLAQARKIPSNINVSFEEDAAMLGFMEQTDIAAIIPNIPAVEAALKAGDSVYEQVLINDIDPAQAVQDFTTLVDIANGFEVETQDGFAASECIEEGQVSLWHSWNEVELLAWQTVISNFVEICPNIQIQPVFVDKHQLTQALTHNLEADSEIVPPDVFIAPHTSLEFYQSQELLKDITDLVDQDRLTSYWPKALQALYNKDALYGLPLDLDVPVLYYQSDLVEEPAISFDELLIQSRQGLTVALTNGFYDLLWGGAAFGCEPCQTGQYFNEQGELILTEADLAEWRTWLQTAAETNSFILSEDEAEIKKMFLEGHVAYIVAGAHFLHSAEKELGPAHFGLTLLPRSLDKEKDQLSRPLLTVESFFFYHDAVEEQIKLALKFAQFATSEENQIILEQIANYIPTHNINLARVDDEAMATIVSSLDTSVSWPTMSQLAILKASSVYTTFDNLENTELSDEASDVPALPLESGTPPTEDISESQR